MFGFGMPELIVVLVIVLVVFGAGRLPEIGGALGRSIRNFKKASNGKEEIEIKASREEEERAKTFSFWVRSWPRILFKTPIPSILGSFMSRSTKLGPS